MLIEIIAGNIRSTARQELAELAVKHRLPVMRGRPEHVEASGLMSYGVNLTRPGPARRYVRGQDSERREARGTPGGAADEVRADYQPESGEADRNYVFRRTSWWGRIE